MITEFPNWVAALFDAAGERVSDWSPPDDGVFRFLSLRYLEPGAQIRVAGAPGGGTLLGIDVQTCVNQLDEVSFDLRDVVYE